MGTQRLDDAADPAGEEGMRAGDPPGAGKGRRQAGAGHQHRQLQHHERLGEPQTRGEAEPRLGRAADWTDDARGSMRKAETGAEKSIDLRHRSLFAADGRVAWRVIGADGIGVTAVSRALAEDGCGKGYR